MNKYKVSKEIKWSLQHFSIHLTLKQRAFILWVSDWSFWKELFRKIYVKAYGKMLMHCTVYFFFSDESIYVKFLHSDNKYVDRETLRCLSVLWWIKTYSEQTAQKTDLVLTTHEEQQLTCQLTFPSLQGRGERDFPHQGSSKMVYWHIPKNKELREGTSCIYDSCHNIPLFSDLVEIGQYINKPLADCYLQWKMMKHNLKGDF